MFRNPFGDVGGGGGCLLPVQLPPPRPQSQTCQTSQGWSIQTCQTSQGWSFQTNFLEPELLNMRLCLATHLFLRSAK